ncbi:MAG: sensor histidine kinase, partial [Spirochaetales bacterium]|nr:sensor histidine kinase [Spirochaetales bacterium]
EDQGPGIPEKEKERIFERFYRTERGREKEGTGLGLSIVKHIIVLHRGRVQVESPPPRQKQGTRFSLIFPCQAPVTATDS